MKPKVIVTIDPGSSNGGIVFWKQSYPPKPIRMPKNDELDRLSDYFNHIIDNNNDVVVFIEQISMFLSDDNINEPAIQYRLQTLMANFQRIIAFLVHKKIPYVPVYPISWQSTLKLRIPGSTNKEKKQRFKDFAQSTFPEVKVFLWNSDALCILQFAHLKYENDVSWINERIKNVQNNKLF